eukprot:11194209-Lingulodinium_polyedra.AAC.1
MENFTDRHPNAPCQQQTRSMAPQGPLCTHRRRNNGNWYKELPTPTHGAMPSASTETPVLYCVNGSCPWAL